MLPFLKTMSRKYVVNPVSDVVTGVTSVVTGDFFAVDFSSVGDDIDPTTFNLPSTESKTALPSTASIESVGVTSETDSSQSDRVLQQRPSIVPPLNLKNLLPEQNDEQKQPPLLTLQRIYKQPAEDGSCRNQFTVLKENMSRLLSQYIKSRTSSSFFQNKALAAEKVWLANGLLEHIQQAKSENELLQGIQTILQKNKDAEERLSRLPTFFARKQNDGGDLERALMAMQRSIPKA